MLTLYTAIGHLKLKKNANGNPVPMIVNGPHEYGMCEHEMVLWSCLAFQILNFHELESAYDARLQKINAKEGMPLSHYINRLLLRGLIAKGEALTAVDALYRLLGELQIHLIDDRFQVRLFSCIQLFLEGKIRCQDFAKYLKKGKNNPIEETVLELARTVPLTTAELVICVDKGKRIRNKADVLNTLYEDTETTYLTLAEDAQLQHIQYPVLQAIGNLYLNKQISFMKV